MSFLYGVQYKADVGLGIRSWCVMKWALVEFGGERSWSVKQAEVEEYQWKGRTGRRKEADLTNDVKSKRHLMRIYRLPVET